MRDDAAVWPDGVRPHPQHADLLQCADLAALDGFGHAFETRRGSLQTLLPTPIARLRQVHGARVARLPDERARRAAFFETDVTLRPAADALITNATGVTLAVSVADCLPILVADAEGGAVAAVHGGWRGLVAGVIEATFETMSVAFGTDPGRCRVAIGPGIGPCCYEVGPEVLRAFAERGLEHVAVRHAVRQRPHVDLRAAARGALQHCGVPHASVFVAEVCTRCHGDVLWSYRRDGDDAGRMLCGIARLT